MAHLLNFCNSIEINFSAPLKKGQRLYKLYCSRILWMYYVFCTALIPHQCSLLVADFFISSSRMAISRSYPGHFFKFWEKKRAFWLLFLSQIMFFKKTQLFIIMHLFFGIWLSAWWSAAVIPLLSAWLSIRLSNASQSDKPVSLSYPMAIYSANEIRAF